MASTRTTTSTEPDPGGDDGTGTIRRRVIARGEVQGVFFRASVARLAEQLGVAGFARNRDDGAVEMAFEGPVDAVEQLIAYSADGPEHARVSGLDVTAEDPRGVTGFGTG